MYMYIAVLLGCDILHFTEPMCDTKTCLNCTLPNKCDQCKIGHMMENGECVPKTTKSPGSGSDDGGVTGKC